ncbi:unnamed protein product [Brachionus calyciflorus]|uniref:Uncharacterized protein n=1 Tax=Brachionus calyciflorus TaxID=104777 RepID=A0A814K5E1_9BILA|nr:unnamed protein product [Brachionus calyciflorus]
MNKNFLKDYRNDSPSLKNLRTRKIFKTVENAKSLETCQRNNEQEESLVNPIDILEKNLRVNMTFTVNDMDEEDEDDCDIVFDNQNDEEEYEEEHYDEDDDRLQ